MDQFMYILELIDKYIWGIPLCALIIGCGIWLTLRVRFLQIRHLGRALKYMVHNEAHGEGEVTSFGAPVSYTHLWVWILHIPFSRSHAESARTVPANQSARLASVP